MPAYVSILRIRGPFLFGTTDKLAEETADLKQFNHVIILRLRDMTAIDATGLHAIGIFAKRVTEDEKSLAAVRRAGSTGAATGASDFVERIGPEKSCPTLPPLWRARARSAKTSAAWVTKSRRTTAPTLRFRFLIASLRRRFSPATNLSGSPAVHKSRRNREI